MDKKLIEEFAIQHNIGMADVESLVIDLLQQQREEITSAVKNIEINIEDRNNYNARNLTNLFENIKDEVLAIINPQQNGESKK